MDGDFAKRKRADWIGAIDAILASLEADLDGNEASGQLGVVREMLDRLL